MGTTDKGMPLWSLARWQQTQPLSLTVIRLAPPSPTPPVPRLVPGTRVSARASVPLASAPGAAPCRALWPGRN
jgi:hypothetical protein